MFQTIDIFIRASFDRVLFLTIKFLNNCFNCLSFHYRLCLNLNNLDSHFVCLFFFLMKLTLSQNLHEENEAVNHSYGNSLLAITRHVPTSFP